MSNFLVLGSDKLIPDTFWNDHKYKGESCCGSYSSYFEEFNSKSVGLNEPELIKYTYKLKSPIYFELEDETKNVKEIYTETKKLLLWLHNIIKELIRESFAIKLIKVNIGNDDDIMIYEQNIDISYLLQDNVAFDSYVIYCVNIEVK